MKERLIYRKTLKDGRILAVNTWKTGFQELVYADRPAFDRAKHACEVEGKPLQMATSFAEVGR
jgi:hypothetical protein